MTHHFLVLHFGAQCPWQPWVVEQAQQAAEQLDGTVHVADVAKQPELAAYYRLFFPFMTVVDGTRVVSPLLAEELLHIAADGLVVPPATFTSWGPPAQAEAILPLTAVNITDTCGLCIRADKWRGCQAKAKWAASITRKVSDGVLGFVAYQGSEAVGVVEFLPAPLIPYPLPDRKPDVAFITCIYSTEDRADSRGQLLEWLAGYLQSTGYRELQVIAGQHTAYPNGPQTFFLQYSFQPVSELDRIALREGEEVLVLLRRKLYGRSNRSQSLS